MATIENKVVTVESLKTLHEHNKEAYMAKTDVIPIENGGINATDGATGIMNLFAAGGTVLSSYQYGDTLPAAGNKGRIFFKRLTD